MSYTKQTWQSGDTITAQKLNHIEDGIADGGVLFINVDDNGVMDKTWQQIYDAPFAVARLGSPTTVWAVSVVDEMQGEYGVVLLDLANPGNPGEAYTTDSADGYPSTSK